ncbi:glycosyltransferase [Lutibacter sp.]|uniref:glycosyltransferase n=1 Tax=Lutibacter sp. TaxID=1925666 RepID=UPI001A1BF912|nr:glycosyltransferase [Lutibacter sp.]MBI9041324.1 glycosyltransferase [Lutibacter sp.]
MKIIKKKILFTIHGLETGGAEKFLISLVNKLDHSKLDCTIISYSKNNPLATELNKEVNLKIFSRNSKFDLKPLVESRQFIKNLKPDLIFCVGFFSFFLTHISNLFNLKKITRIISYHTTIHRNKKDHLLMKMYSKFIRNSDKIVTVCNNQIEYTTQQYKIKRNFFTSIYNGVDTDYWRMPKTLEETGLIRAQFGIPKDAKVIIKIAAFRAEKNHKAAVDAFNILNEKGIHNIFLLFVGDGILKNEIKTYVTNLNLSEKVIFAGNQIDVRPFYWASDIFTLTSNGVETFSIATLEALSCGLPCVLTDIGGANEMILEGVNGYLSNTNYRNIAVQWEKTLITNFDNVKISIATKNKFNLNLMINKYQALLEKST